MIMLLRSLGPEGSRRGSLCGRVLGRSSLSGRWAFRRNNRIGSVWRRWRAPRRGCSRVVVSRSSSCLLAVIMPQRFARGREEQEREGTGATLDSARLADRKLTGVRDRARSETKAGPSYAAKRLPTSPQGADACGGEVVEVTLRYLTTHGNRCVPVRRRGSLGPRPRSASGPQLARATTSAGIGRCSAEWTQPRGS